MFIISIKENPMTTPHLANTDLSAVSAVSAAPTQETASDVPLPGREANPAALGHTPVAAHVTTSPGHRPVAVTSETWMSEDTKGASSRAADERGVVGCWS